MPSNEAGSESVFSNIPWRTIGIGAGVTVVAGGLAYLIYKKSTDSQSSDSSSTEFKDNPKKPVGNKGLAEEATRLKNHGNELFKAGKYEDAIEMYTKALSILPEANVQSAATFYQNRAAAYEKLENCENVIKDCNSAIERNSTYAKAYNRRGKANEKLEKHKEALIDFTTSGVLEQFSNMTTLENADRVLKRHSEIKAKQELKNRPAGATPPLSKHFVDSYCQSFCEDPVFSKVVGAPDGLKGGHGPQEQNGEIRGYDLVLRCLAEKRYEEAMEASSEEIQGAGEKLLEALLVRATFSLILGLGHRADEDFERIFQEIDTRPQDDWIRKIRANTLIKRGSLRMQQGMKDECFQDFDLAQSIDPENADVYHHRGQLEVLLGEQKKAKEHFDKCIELRPDFAVARFQCCYADFRVAMASESTLAVNQSINKFERVLADFPNSSEGYALLGQVYTEKDALADADQMFDKALETNPENANIYVHKGILVLQRSEDYDKARKIMEKTFQIDPNSQFAYETIATLEVQRGNIEEAMQIFDKAIKLARTELELVHLFSLREAAQAQIETFRRLKNYVPMPPGLV